MGMRQRLGIAAALLNDPPLLLLDEPANGLDPAGIVEMRGLLRRLAGEGKTVFVSSHILAEIQLMVDEVAIIAAGRLVRAGRLDDLLGASGRGADPGRAGGRATRHGDPRQGGSGSPRERARARLADRGGRARSCRGAQWTLVTAGVPVSGLESGSGLEELFLSLTEG